MGRHRSIAMMKTTHHAAPEPSTTKTTPVDSHLAELRELVGWSQRRTAQELCELPQHSDRSAAGAAVTIANAERGTREIRVDLLWDLTSLLVEQLPKAPDPVSDQTRKLGEALADRIMAGANRAHLGAAPIQHAPLLDQLGPLFADLLETCERMRKAHDPLLERTELLVEQGQALMEIARDRDESVGYVLDEIRNLDAMIAHLDERIVTLRSSLEEVKDSGRERSGKQSKSADPRKENPVGK